jgi:hypothetical protein
MAVPFQNGDRVRLTSKYRGLGFRPGEAGTARQETARIWNLSTGGIGLWLAHSIAAGTIVQLRFQHRRVTDRSAQVLNASAEGQAWVVHCLFDRPLSPAEFRMLLT